ncbi:MAG: MmgE/PrpD family protein [Deltaproteobacteria bacterium]|nr:MmgE/PrpD family protein [Deltaproteobacteria bacterium]MBW1909837.1 MmgE/PrpD family protein [Deltaproteobacteria bacterium]MBW2033454.1 MmgE/PrpD family protein [Deltaproteobacteria bacterium]MBW2114101.1 MmgE/PrpD family protein [Deltaproteobacteria bacterium]MBW2357221.1 MmgE/PrpD family protein [Deltaproteobacteria bacterium]
MSVTRKIVEYIIGARFEDIPPAAVAKTKEFILDEIGNALGGSVLRSGKIIIEWGKQLGGVPEATIISNGIKVPVGISSGVNTQLCMGLELMETYKNRGHPGSGMVMTALAFGEKEKINGKEMLTAVCTAYDVTGRIIDATFPSPEHRMKVWNESWQGCGPLVVAIRLLGLNEEEAMHAFGMGLGNGPTMNVHNILYVPGSMSKLGNQFHNFVGINAALLAKLGYTGFHEILDEPYPYWTTITDSNDWEIYTKNLGKDFFITSAMAFKPWPTCRWAQPGIESLLEIIKSNGLKPEDIKEVIYHAHEKVTGYPYDNIAPGNPEDAYWSVPWPFANAALGYKPGPAWYVEDRFKDEELKKFMKKVQIKTLPEAVEAFAKEPEKSVTLLEVRATSGDSYSKKTEYCKGDPQKPMSHGEIIEKFLGQTKGIVSDKKAQKIVDTVEMFEGLKDIEGLVSALY